MTDPSDGNPGVPKRSKSRLGWVLLIVFLLFGLSFLAVHLAQQDANRAVWEGNKWQSRSNLNQIGLAIQLYAADHGGLFPDSFGTLLLIEDIPAETFISPAIDDAPATGPPTQAVADEISNGRHVSYHYLGRGLSQATAAPDTVIAYEEPGIFPDGGNVLYADGNVRFVDADTLKKIAAKPATMP